MTRVLALKAALGLHHKNTLPETEEAEAIVGCAEHKKWAVEVADKGITLVKEEKGVLPITPEKYHRILLYRIEPTGEGYSIYKVSPAIESIKQKLIDEASKWTNSYPSLTEKDSPPNTKTWYPNMI